MQVPFGTRVRLVQDFADCDEHIISLLRGKKLEAGPLSVSFSDDLTSNLVLISKGSEGIVATAPYCSGIYNYRVETPVNFDMFSKGEGLKGFDKSFAIGIPDEILEAVEDTGKK
jgi:hypothetical protein